MIYIGYTIAKKHLDEFYNGFLNGAIVSGIFGILQYLFWVILKYDFIPLRGINNCNSFANAGLTPNILEVGRIFGFTPEPSIYGLLMISALVIAFEKKKIFQLTVIVIGIFMSMSLSSLLLILVYIIYKFRNSILFKIMLVLCLVISLYIVKNILESVDLSNVSTNANLIERVSNLSQNGSFISRMNSILAASNLVATHPLIGIGYNEQLNELIVENAIASVEVNTGINSLLLLLMSIFGIPTTLLFLYPIIKLFIFRREKHLILLSFTMVVPALFTLGYYSFYLPWVGIGFVASVVFSQNKNKKITV